MSLGMTECPPLPSSTHECTREVELLDHQSAMVQRYHHKSGHMQHLQWLIIASAWHNSSHQVDLLHDTFWGTRRIFIGMERLNHSLYAQQTLTYLCVCSDGKQVLKRRSFIDGGGSYTVEFQGLHLSVAIVDSAHGFFYGLAINGIVSDQPSASGARQSSASHAGSAAPAANAYATCREELSWNASFSSYHDSNANAYHALAASDDS